MLGEKEYKLSSDKRKTSAFTMYPRQHIPVPLASPANAGTITLPKKPKTMAPVLVQFVLEPGIRRHPDHAVLFSARSKDIGSDHWVHSHGS